MLDLISSKITGTPGESGWAQVHDYKPDDPEKMRTRGHLFAVAATKRTQGGEIDAISAGRELIGRIHEEYYGETVAKPFNALKAAVEKVISEFKTTWGDVEIAACALVENVVYSAAGGGGEVVVCRNGNLGTILSSQKEGAVISASGFPQKGDMILMGTNLFFKQVSQGALKAALTSQNPESAVEVLAPGIHSGESLGSLGAVIVKYDERENFSNIPPVIPTDAVKESAVRAQEIVKAKTAGVLHFVGSLLKKIPRRNIYIRPAPEDEVSSRSKKMTFSVAVILLVLLGVSIGFGVRQKKINDQRTKYESILTDARKNIEEAISLSSVSPERSRELFRDSQEKISQIESLDIKDKQVEELKTKFEESKEAILGEYNADPVLFLDLSLLSSGFKGDVISSSGGNIYVLDKNTKRVVSINYSTKKSKVAAGPGVLENPKDMASYEDRVFVLEDDGIYEVAASKNKVIEKEWEGDALIRAFAGNIYVLDKSSNLIYRYQGSGNAFGSRQNWLTGGVNVNFSEVVQWVIDGSVYTLSGSSKILKFSLGSPQNFSIKGVYPEIGKVDAIFAGDGVEGVYLLDKAGKRVVVLDKKGGYKAQYIGEGIGNATNLAVSEADKKIILLTGDKLNVIDIKHLR